MRIISKFHDYYDSVLAYGYDPACVYVRKTERVPWQDRRVCEDKILKQVGDVVAQAASFVIPDTFKSFDPFAILFCGQLHFGAHVVIETGWMQSNDGHAYSVDDVDGFRLLARKPDDWADDEKPRRWELKYSTATRMLSRRERLFTRENMGNFFKHVELDPAAVHAVHDKFGAPVIAMSMSGTNHMFRVVQSPAEIVINPVLKKVEFFKKIDPFTAMQDLSCYVSGVMGGQAPKMIEISDEVRIEKHGFDTKQSFRKRKEE